MNMNKNVIKILVMGDRRIKKADILQRYVHGALFGKVPETGLYEKQIALKVDGTIVSLQLWDLTTTLSDDKTQGVNGVILVSDLTELDDIERVSKMKEEVDSRIRLASGQRMPVMLLGHKKYENESVAIDKSAVDALQREHRFSAYFDLSLHKNTLDRCIRHFVDKIMESQPNLVVRNKLSAAATSGVTAGNRMKDGDQLKRHSSFNVDNNVSSQESDSEYKRLHEGQKSRFACCCVVT